MKITLDPGHGKNSNKGVLSGYYEGTQVFKLAQYLKTELEKYTDVTVYLTKDDVTDNPSLEERGGMARYNGSDLFISLHTNAASDEKAHGVSVFRGVNNEGSAVFGRRLGDAVAKLMYKKTGTTYLRGVFTRTYQSTSGKTLDYYGVIRSAVAGGLKYAYIIEHGFHTNKSECAYMMNDDNLKAIAKLEAELIAQQFALVKLPDAAQSEGCVTYTVKKGDTLGKIANKYGLSVACIAEYNNISNPDLIVIGRELKIPYPASDTFRVGDRVRIKEYKTTYFPGGKSFSAWVKTYDYTVARVSDRSGNDVMRGGDKCVLLGNKINRETGEITAPINSWSSVNYITRVN